MFRFLLSLALVASLSALIPDVAAAQSEGRSPEDVVQVELLEGWRLADGRHIAALAIRLAPGWKTYWRAPGEGGIPPRLRLTRATGVEAVSMHWPVPEVFYSNGMRSIGYRDDVILPLEIVVEDGHDRALRLSGRIDLGVCQDVCMPVTLQLRGSLPAGGRPDPRIAAALADAPLSAAEAGAGPVTCRITPIRDGLRVEARIPLRSAGNSETVVFELPDPGIWISTSQTARSGGILTATADFVPPDAGPFALNRSDLRVTVLGSRMAVELSGCTAD